MNKFKYIFARKRKEQRTGLVKHSPEWMKVEVDEKGIVKATGKIEEEEEKRKTSCACRAPTVNCNGIREIAQICGNC